jgi:hypothetical protein
MGVVFALVVIHSLLISHNPTSPEFTTADAYDSVQDCEAAAAAARASTSKQDKDKIFYKGDVLQVEDTYRCVAMPPSSPCLRVAIRLNYCPIGCTGINVFPLKDPARSQWKLACRPTLINTTAPHQPKSDALRYTCNDGYDKSEVSIDADNRSVHLTTFSGNSALESITFRDGYKATHFLAIFSQFVKISPNIIEFGEVDGIKGTLVRTYIFDRGSKTLRLVGLGGRAQAQCQ